MKRKHLVEQFSTFLEVDDRNDYLDSRWQSSARLCNNIRKAIATDPNAKEEYWAKHWLTQILQNSKDSLARGHLAAYLEEVCYITIIKITPILSVYNLRKVDCFLIAREAAVKVEKVFKTYDFKTSGVKTYAEYRIRGEVLQTLRRGREEDKYSWSALLRNTSQKRLLEVLTKAGFKEPELSRFLLAFNSFKSKYVPTKQKGSKQLQPPTAKQLGEIALFYRQCHPKKEPITVEEIQRLLDTCVKLLKETSIKSFASLDELDLEREELITADNSGEASDSEERQEVKSVLVNAFMQLTPTERQMLELAMGLNFNQGDLTDVFGYKKQYEVSRELKNKRKELLKVFARWSEANLGVKLSSQQLGNLDKIVKEWLKSYCRGVFSKIVKSALVRETPENIEMLRLHFGGGKSLAEVANLTGVDEKELKSNLTAIKANFQRELAAKVAENYSISLEACKSADKSIAKFVDVYLQTAPYAILKSNLKKSNRS
jgi:RNA polymerase sigma factor (sigma-70 family)